MSDIAKGAVRYTKAGTDPVRNLAQNGGIGVVHANNFNQGLCRSVNDEYFAQRLVDSPNTLPTNGKNAT